MAGNNRTTQKEIDDMRAELAKAKSATQVKSVVAYKKYISKAVYFAVVLCLAWILVSIESDRAKGEPPSVFGFYFLTVQSGSMQPTLMVGDTILVKKTNAPEKLSVGNVVTYRDSNNNVVTHRIVRIQENEYGELAYATKGENPLNAEDADLLLPINIYGVYVLTLPF